MAAVSSLPPVAPHQQQMAMHPEDEVDVDQLLAGPLAMPDRAIDPRSYNQQQNNHLLPEGFTAISPNIDAAAATLSDPNRAQNVGLKVQLAASERELAQCRHALDLALVKAGNWSGMKHRVQLAKPLNPAPLKQWATAPTAADHSQQNSGDPNTSRASFVINSLQSQLREKDVQLANAQTKLDDMAAQLRESRKREASAAASAATALQNMPASGARSGGVSGGATAEHILGGSDEAKTAIHAHFTAQMHFLHSETERLEAALAEQRERENQNTVQRGMQTARELQQRDQKIAQLSNALSSLKSKLTPLQKAALNATKEGEASPMDLLTRIGELERDLSSAITARNDALNDKYALNAKVRKLEEKVRDAKSNVTETTNSAVEEVMQSAQQVARLRDALATASRERDNLQAALDIRKLRDASKRLSSVECQTDRMPVMTSGAQTDPTERPKAEAFCQVEAADGAYPPLSFLPPGTSTKMAPAQTLSSSSSSASASASAASRPVASTSSVSMMGSGGAGGGEAGGTDALSVAHALELKCAELDNVRARLEEQSLQHERAQLALKQTREALGAEIEVRKNLDGESDRNKSQVRTLQQTVSQLHVLLRDRDAALAAADERAQTALNDSVKLAEERKNWEKQLAANAHDFEQLLAQQNTASQQVSQASSENEALREEVSKLLQREAQLSHALRAKDGELGEILSSYQMCVQENEATQQSAKSIERECNNLKAALQMREERVVELQREISALHQREEQLTTDVQACDYENGLLHRKVVQAETQLQSLQSTITDQEQQLHAQRRVTSEFERAQAELHKLMIVKDNEVVLLRRRCEQVEHEFTLIQTQQNVMQTKMRELDETNARLTVSGIMHQLGTSPAAAAAENRAREVTKSRQNMDELAQRNGFLARQIEVKDGAIAQLQNQIAEEKRNIEMLRIALSEKTVALERTDRNMEELKRKLVEQSRMLAMHASHTGMSDSDA